MKRYTQSELDAAVAEAEKRAEQRLLARLTPDDTQNDGTALTLSDVAKMTPEQVAARLPEVGALQADPQAWAEYVAAAQNPPEAA